MRLPAPGPGAPIDDACAERRCRRGHRGESPARRRAPARRVAGSARRWARAHGRRSSGSSGRRATRPSPGVSPARPWPGHSPRLAVARLVAAPDAEDAFNPGSIVHDLRRAIDQSDISDDWKGAGMSMRPTTRKVDADLVIRVLDGLSAEPDRAGRGALRGAGGERPSQRPLRGRPVQRAVQPQARPADAHHGPARGHGRRGRRTGRRTRGSRRSPPSCTSCSPTTSSSEAKRERVMALYRRRPDDIAGIDQHYERLYGHRLDRGPRRTARRACSSSASVKLRRGTAPPPTRSRSRRSAARSTALEKPSEDGIVSARSPRTKYEPAAREADRRHHRDRRPEPPRGAGRPGQRARRPPTRR